MRMVAGKEITGRTEAVCTPRKYNGGKVPTAH